ncbi:MAG: hypothetical protein HPY89_00780 [Pelotomaculum sp.]|nr:hypothetical protein [Pelotomaculum sp.]
MNEMVFAADQTGRIVGTLALKQAENAIAKGRAKWVGVNVVQFQKVFRRPENVEISHDGHVPLPGSARPELVYSDKNTEEVRDCATRLTGKYARETIQECWAAAREACAASEAPAPRGYGEMAQALRLAAGEKPIFRGASQDRVYTYAGPVRKVAEAVTAVDVGRGLTGMERKIARRRAFRALERLRDELREIAPPPSEELRRIWKKLPRGDRTIREVMFLLTGLYGKPEYGIYKQKLENIITKSQEKYKKPGTAVV